MILMSLLNCLVSVLNYFNFVLFWDGKGDMEEKGRRKFGDSADQENS